MKLLVIGFAEHNEADEDTWDIETIGIPCALIFSPIVIVMGGWIGLFIGRILERIAVGRQP